MLSQQLFTLSVLSRLKHNSDGESNGETFIMYSENC